MELTIIPNTTTWNNAASGINSNFAKLLQAILALESSSSGAGLDEAQLQEYLVQNGYTTEQWVEAQKFLKSISKSDIQKALGYEPISPEELDRRRYATQESVDEVERRVTITEDDIEKINHILQYLSVDEEKETLNITLNIATPKEISAGGAGSEMEGEGSGGSLESLSDVDIHSMPVDEYERKSQVIAYSTISGKWTNKTTMMRFTPESSSKKWKITHNLNKMPNVKVIDSTGALVHGTVVYGDENGLNRLNTLTISFGGEFMGTAYLD